MIKFCVEQWGNNKEKLEKYFEEMSKDELLELGYIDLVKAIVKCIFNNNEKYSWDSERITEIDNGYYQGTLLYLIPEDRYQPDEAEYLMTYVGYGSCSGCDTLLSIKAWFNDKDEIIKDYISLCKDIVQNTIKPYNAGWRQDDIFNTVDIKEIE